MTPLREVARTLFQQALDDCSVEQAMARTVSVQDGKLRIVHNEAVSEDAAKWEDWLDLTHLRRVLIVAVGKAASTMLAALLKQFPWPKSCEIAGILIAPQPLLPLPLGFQYFCGGHPTPDEASFAGAQAALSLLQAIPAKESASTLCIFLISGGASALMELPLDPAIGLADTAAFHRVLVGSGASIAEINCVRKHFSAVKGGRLALAARNSPCLSLFVSDVPAGQLETLGSGATLPDTSTIAQCREILVRYGLPPLFPASVRDFFASSELPETPHGVMPNARSCILLEANDLAEAAARRARALGWTTVIDSSCDEWDYQAAAVYLLERVRALRKQFPRVCLISAGEVLVSLPANPGDRAIGVGGRNQQFALFAATLLQPTDGSIAILSAGSDGIDGNSPAAGAVVDMTTLESATTTERSHPNPGLSPALPSTLVPQKMRAQTALASFDAYPFLAKYLSTITTGPTGHNLRDLRILLACDPDQKSPQFHKS